MNKLNREKILIQFNKIFSNNDYKIICLTGKMASGKNFVSSLLEESNSISIDLDKEVHKIIELKSNEIFNTFEQIAIKNSIQIRNQDNSLNRKNLGSLLFSDNSLLLKQEKIIYPELTNRVLQFISESKKNHSEKRIILNATVLYKIPDIMNLCDAIFFVQSNYVKRLLRAKHRDNSSFTNIIKRFNSQRSLLSKYKIFNLPIYKIFN